MTVDGPDHVWCTDITYLLMRRGWLYLVAIMNWFSRHFLAWELSVTLDASFCVSALERALSLGTPRIFNTDQGSQFTSVAFTGVLRAADVAISMDGAGRVYDNIFVERLWRSVKYEEVYLKDYQTPPEAQAGLGWYFSFYNQHRPHTTLAGRTPDEMYFACRPANTGPRYEPRWGWPRPAPCANPTTLIRGAPGVRLEMELSFHGGRKHLPVIELHRAA